MSYLVTFRTEEPPASLCTDCPYHFYVTDPGENYGRICCELLHKLIPKEYNTEESWDGCPVTETSNDMKSEETEHFATHPPEDKT
jgi:hypothetical protein